MGVWQWLREYINLVTIFGAQPQFLHPGMDVDRIAHILQWSVEGGHWMLTPPRLLTLVHAVQQPLGRPAFTALTVQRQPESGSKPLKTQPESLPHPADRAEPADRLARTRLDGRLPARRAVHPRRQLGAGRAARRLDRSAGRRDAAGALRDALRRPGG